jgi:hypothetical protein
VKAVISCTFLLLTGCAAYLNSFPDRDHVEPDPCLSQGGVWHKGPDDQHFYCVDKEILKEILKWQT